MALPSSHVPPSCPPPWQTPLQLRHHLARLLDDAELLTAVVDELEALNSVKEVASSKEKEEASLNVVSSSSHILALCEAFKGRSLDELGRNEASALECATSLQQSIMDQVAPLLSVLEEKGAWEEVSAFARLSAKRSKMLRNRKRRKKRRQLAAETCRKEKERYDQADFEADEWRARKIAKDIAKRKIEKMKEVAKKNAKMERQRLERELELVLIVEKLQELRALRIQRLKKQGSFFPEEDNRFMERVRAAVEEEERQAAAAADTKATAAAIANAQEAGKATLPPDWISEAPKQDAEMANEGESVQTKESHDVAQGSKDTNKERSKIENTTISPHDGTLPAEFYHYYYGSTVDIGTLIEVRRFWDSFILPGG
ncbi:hypothetical protein GOP47_0023626, partial [Adiantum capillus-veneris]